MAAYSGAWRRRTAERHGGATVQPPPMHAGLDPEHLHPTPEPEPGPIPWVSTVPGDPVPAEALGGPPGLPDPSGIGPVADDDGAHLGVLPGLSLAEAQAARGAAHMTDDGSVAVTGWTHSPDVDGTPHLDEVRYAYGDGDSPETLRLQRTGVESPLDPGARRGKRVRRWWDRYIDMHRYQPEFPPKLVRNARPAATAYPPPEPTQRDSQLPTIQAAIDAVTSPDRFVAPMLRRTPRDWQETDTTDGTPVVPVNAPSAFGLTTWGI